MAPNQEQIMEQSGYVTATKCAEAIGAEHLGTVHRMVKNGKLHGCQVASHWYVSVQSMLDEFAAAPPIVARIKALGVKPHPYTKARRA